MGRHADIATDSNRAFLASHPWIRFSLGLADFDWRFWEQLGEARSKCRHLATSPLPPGLAHDLSSLYLAKGVLATTAIEGNTLTEEQALDAVKGRLELPIGQDYQRREIENILTACEEIEREIFEGDGTFEISPERLKRLNRQVLDGLELDEGVVPGEYRDGGVVVGNVYRGAPAVDCDFLMELMCSWINSPDFRPVDDDRESFLRVFARAVLAHVYIAWIHPFGDGNGRTARLVEFGVLTAAGVPTISGHLLSNHYNATRPSYYRNLDRASKSGGDLADFFRYAVEGFVGELQLQLDHVRELNLEAVWRTYVDEEFENEHTKAPRRQRNLVLSLNHEAWTSRATVSTLTPDLALAYAGKGPRTVARDINALVARGLVERSAEGIRARREVMLGFLPRRVDGPAV